MRDVSFLLTFILASTLLTKGSHAAITLDSDGIDSEGLNLTGAGVAIGQAEPNRPGDPDRDLPANHHSQVNPFQVYIGGSVALMVMETQMGQTILFGNGIILAICH